MRELSVLNPTSIMESLPGLRDKETEVVEVRSVDAWSSRWCHH